jgi:hypothetical protein
MQVNIDSPLTSLRTTLLLERWCECELQQYVRSREINAMRGINIVEVIEAAFFHPLRPSGDLDGQKRRE